MVETINTDFSQAYLWSGHGFHDVCSEDILTMLQYLVIFLDKQNPCQIKSAKIKVTLTHRSAH